MRKIRNTIIFAIAALLLGIIVPQKSFAATIPSAVGSTSEVHVSSAYEFENALRSIPIAGKTIILDADLSGYQAISEISVSANGVVVIDLNGHELKAEGYYGIALSGEVDMYVINSASEIYNDSGIDRMRNISYITFTYDGSAFPGHNYYFAPAMFVLNDDEASISIFAQAEYCNDEKTKRITPYRGIEARATAQSSSFKADFISISNAENYGNGKAITLSGLRASASGNIIEIMTNYERDVKIRIVGNAKLDGNHIISGTYFDHYCDNVELAECTLSANGTNTWFYSSESVSKTDRKISGLIKDSTGVSNGYWGYADGDSGSVSKFTGATAETMHFAYGTKYIRSKYSSSSGYDNVLCYSVSGHIVENNYTKNFTLRKHTYINGKVVEPTCTSTGYTERVCNKCQHLKIANTTNMLPHSYTVVKIAAKAPTCTAKGMTAIMKCANCTEVTGGDEIAELGHDWDNGTITPATVAAEGRKVQKCKRTGCTETKTTIIPKLVAPAAGATISAGGSSYKVVKPATGGAEVEYTQPAAGATGDIEVPASIISSGVSYKVTSIAAKAFKGSQITSVKIGDNVLTIGKEAFSGCKKLKKVTMGANVTTIGDKAFYKCTALTSVKIPKNVAKIGKSAFEGCSKLKTVTISTKKLTKSKVGTNAFKSINSKAVVKVPSSKLSAYKTILKARGIKGAGQKIKK